MLPGDTVVVWKLDRLGRSTKDLLAVVTGLGERGVGFRSLAEAVDTTTAGGRLVFHIFAALAEFEQAPAYRRWRYRHGLTYPSCAGWSGCSSANAVPSKSCTSAAVATRP